MPLHAEVHPVTLSMHCRRAEFYEAARLRLGHDPLREDADAEALWEKVQVSKKPVGGILMDQTMIAGVGNIYRAEILFKVGKSSDHAALLVS